MSNAEKRRSGCSISFSLDVLGDKWNLLEVQRIQQDKQYKQRIIRRLTKESPSSP